MLSVFRTPGPVNGDANVQSPSDDTVLLSVYQDLDQFVARQVVFWANHGPADSPYLTPDEAEQAEADSVWAKLNDIVI